MKVSVIIPWRSGDFTRERSLAYIQAHYQAVFPSAEIITTDGPNTCIPFNKGPAINLGVKQSSGEILIFADADSYVPHSQLHTAIEVARQCSFVVPFTKIHYLTHSSTNRVLGNGYKPVLPTNKLLQFRLWDKPSVGVCNVVRREAFEQSGGFDERFIGWGHEDGAWRIIMEGLFGPHVKLPGIVYHLEHFTSRRRESPEYRANMELSKQYQTAELCDDAFNRLLQERGIEGR